MYAKGDLEWGTVTDTRTEDYNKVTGAYLNHSCNDWVIGGKEEIKALIEDLQALLETK